MKYLVKYLIMISIALPVYADFNRTTGFIDIPKADILPHFGYRIGFDGSVGIGGDDADFDKNVHAALGIANWFEIYVDAYTFSGSPAIGFGICHKFYDRGDLAISWGVCDISYAKHISEVGYGDSIGWYDDLSYTHDEYEKPFELGSAFLVSTYSFKKYLDFTIGLGRGKFVGYGNHSKFLNSNVHSSEGGDWAVGLFGGIDIRPFNNFAFMIEVDGRDLNTGFVYQYKPIMLGLALTKIEHILWSSEEYYPRVSFSLSYVKDTEAPRLGRISGTVFDKNGSPLTAEVGFFDKDISPVMTKAEIGTFSFDGLNPGTYEIYVKAEGLKGATKQIKVSSGKTIYYDFELETNLKSGSIVGKIIDIKTNEPVTAYISIPQINRSVACNAVGMFEINDLSPSLYQVVIEADGYETGYYQATVNLADRTQLDIRMVKRGMMITLAGIKFDFNKASIRPESEIILSSAATILINHLDIRVEIQGHTDSVGGEKYNRELSQARADAVREYLIKFRNIDPGRLIARGYGEQTPIVSNLTEEGRNQNRRVEFLILK